MTMMMKKRARKTVQNAFLHCFPNTSFVRKICANYLTLMIFYKKVHFYSKFVCFLRTKKRTVVQTRSIFLSELSLKGGMLPQNSVECFNEAPWNNLVQKLELIGTGLGLRAFAIGGDQKGEKELVAGGSSMAFITFFPTNFRNFFLNGYLRRIRNNSTVLKRIF